MTQTQERMPIEELAAIVAKELGLVIIDIDKTENFRTTCCVALGKENDQDFRIEMYYGCWKHEDGRLVVEARPVLCDATGAGRRTGRIGDSTLSFHNAPNIPKVTLSPTKAPAAIAKDVARRVIAPYLEYLAVAIPIRDTIEKNARSRKDALKDFASMIHKEISDRNGSEQSIYAGNLSIREHSEGNVYFQFSTGFSANLNDAYLLFNMLQNMGVVH